MTAKVGISIKEICDRYTIKQSTAYKWRKVLEDLNLELSFENLDKIQNREINLSNPEESALVVSSQSAIASSEPAAISVEIDEPKEILGIPRERFEAINATVKLEVHVEELLRDYHREDIQNQRTKTATQKYEEVKNLDPKEVARQMELLKKKAA